MTVRASAGPHVAAACRFYDYVDAGDVAGLSGLFTEDATYLRPGYPPMTGRSGVATFYSKDRVIREGGHTLEAVVVAGDEIAVRGSFHGILHDGGPVDLRFADFFTVTGDGRFSRRQTFFFTPLV